MPNNFREIEGEVEAFESVCESLVEVDYPLCFEGVNGGRAADDLEVA